MSINTVTDNAIVLISTACGDDWEKVEDVLFAIIMAMPAQPRTSLIAKLSSPYAKMVGDLLDED